MGTYAGRTSNDKSESVASGGSQNHSDKEVNFRLTDNHASAITQKKLQGMASNSPGVLQLHAFQKMANDSPRTKEANRFQSMADNHSTVQNRSFEKNTGRTGLPSKLKANVEHLSGVSMDDVKVHRNSEKPAVVQAKAYAQGTNIHLGPGQEQHLPHETWHVVQQKTGRVKPTTKISGISVNDNPTLEREADTMGSKAIRMQPYKAKASNNQSISEPIQQKNTHNNRSGTNHSKSSVVQRVVETVTVAKDYDALKVLTLRSLVGYANSQADWHAAIADGDERARIRNILYLLRDNDAILAGGSGWKVEDFWGKVKDGETELKAEPVAKLDAYGRGVAEKTARQDSGASIDNALLYGAAIQKLETKIGPITLAYIFLPDSFDTLYTDGNVDDFVSYVDKVKPTLTADDGEEVTAYNELRDEGQDPEAYRGGVLDGNIRNFHRFEKDALDKLVTNYGYTTKDKDLTMILHTTVDDNGAFYRDDELTKLIENATFALMLEGFSTLNAMKAKVSTIAGTHGSGGKIRDLMLAGHGDSRAIGMAGKVEEQDGEVEITEDDLELDDNPDDTQDFIDSILGDLEDNVGNHARLVLNACLTNSNAVDIDEGDFNDVVLDDAKRIRDYIADKPSLALKISQRAAVLGVAVDALGSNSSTTSGVEFVDGNRLVLKGGDDPLLTSPKADYVKDGVEPEGALRAVLEEWAVDTRRAATLTNVETRKDKGDSTDWAEQLIRAMYALIDASYKAKGSAIMALANAASDIFEVKIESEADTEEVSYVLDGRTDDAKFIFGKMMSTDDWSNENYIPLVCYQVWAEHDDAKYIQFAQHLAANYTVKSATKFNFIPASHDFGTTVPEASGAHPAPGQLLLALIGYVSHKDAECKKFLLKYLEGLDTFPQVPDVNALLDGKTSENRVLRDLGKMGEAVAGEKHANLKLDGDGSNKEWVSALTKKGKISEDAVVVKSNKGGLGTNLATLNTDAQIFILGEVGLYYAIESGTKTGFVPKAKVKDVG